MSKRPVIGSAHEALDRMFDSIGRAHGPKGSPSEGQLVAVAFLNIARSTLYRQLDPDQPGDFSFAHACQLAQQFGCTEAAAHLALCAGGVFIPMPDDGDPVSVLTAEAMQEMGEAMAHLFASANPASDGGATVTPSEARAALPMVRDVLIAVSNLYARLSEKAAKGGA